MSNGSSHSANEVLDRLKSAYNLKSDADLADRLGVAPNTVATWRRRDSIPFERILSHCDDLDLNWILKGRNGSQSAIISSPTQDYQLQKKIQIPIYENAAGAGTGERGRDSIMAYGTFFRGWLRNEVGVQLDHLFIAPVRGRSMEDLLVDGDLVLCERVEKIRYEDIYVCWLNDELKVKHVHRAGGTIVLRNENDRYPAIEVGPGDDFDVIGRVVRRVVR